MDEFDYLNSTLEEWAAGPAREFIAENIPATTVIRYIEAEYLPRFEAALHKNAVKALSGNVI